MIAFGSAQATACKYRWLSGAEAMPLKTTLIHPYTILNLKNIEN